MSGRAWRLPPRAGAEVVDGAGLAHHPGRHTSPGLERVRDHPEHAADRALALAHLAQEPRLAVVELAQQRAGPDGGGAPAVLAGGDEPDQDVVAAALAALRPDRQLRRLKGTQSEVIRAI